MSLRKRFALHTKCTNGNAGMLVRDGIFYLLFWFELFRTQEGGVTDEAGQTLSGLDGLGHFICDAVAWDDVTIAEVEM